MPAGLAFREGKEGENFGDVSPFLLHTVVKDSSVGKYMFEENYAIEAIRNALYKHFDGGSNPYGIYSKNSLNIERKVRGSQFYTPLKEGFT